MRGARSSSEASMVEPTPGFRDPLLQNRLARRVTSPVRGGGGLTDDVELRLSRALFRRCFSNNSHRFKFYNYRVST